MDSGVLLILPCRLERLVVRLQSDGELAVASFAEVHARRAGHARDRSESIKPSTNHEIPRHVVSRLLVDTGIALGAERLLGLPIDDKDLLASPSRRCRL